MLLTTSCLCFISYPRDIYMYKHLQAQRLYNKVLICGTKQHTITHAQLKTCICKQAWMGEGKKLFLIIELRSIIKSCIKGHHQVFCQSSKVTSCSEWGWGRRGCNVLRHEEKKKKASRTHASSDVGREPWNLNGRVTEQNTCFLRRGAGAMEIKWEGDGAYRDVRYSQLSPRHQDHWSHPSVGHQSNDKQAIFLSLNRQSLSSRDKIWSYIYILPCTLRFYCM